MRITLVVIPVSLAVLSVLTSDCFVPVIGTRRETNIAVTQYSRETLMDLRHRITKPAQEFKAALKRLGLRAFSDPEESVFASRRRR